MTALPQKNYFFSDTLEINSAILPKSFFVFPFSTFFKTCIGVWVYRSFTIAEKSSGDASSVSTLICTMGLISFSQTSFLFCKCIYLRVILEAFEIFFFFFFFFLGGGGGVKNASTQY